MNHVNFLPPSFYAEKARRQRIVRQFALLIALAIALCGFFSFDRGHNHELKKAVEAAEADAAAAADLVKQVAQLQDQKKKLDAEMELRRRVSQSASTSQVIAAVGRAMPGSVTLTRLTLLTQRPPQAPVIVSVKGDPNDPTKSAAKSRNAIPSPDLIRVEITGIAPDDSHVTQFLSGLSGNPLFVNLKLAHSRAMSGEDLIAREFRIDAEVPLDRDYKPAAGLEVARVP